jgi:flagellin
MNARISHNLPLKEFSRNLGVHNADAARNIQHLSSGQRVERASDDPASLALADGLQSEVRVLVEGNRNLQQGISLLQVADGALNEVSAMVAQMRALAVQAGSVHITDSNRRTVDDNFQALKNEVQRLANVTEYNGVSLFTEEREFVIQFGGLEGDGESMAVTLGDMRSTGPTLNIGGVTLLNLQDAQEAIPQMEAVIEKVTAERSRIGAFQNRLERGLTNTSDIMNSLRSTESAIRDIDVARGVAELSRAQILTQTAAILARETDADIDRVLSLLQ